MGELPTGTVTFLFTDIEGSTPLWDAHPDAMRSALARHDEIVRKAIVGADGHVFSTGGDGFGAVFTRAGNAVAAAVAAQTELGAEPWPEHVALRVRMGVHTGEVQERGGDYFGPPVNRAARLMGAAHGGQIVISALTADLLDAPAVGVELVDLGSVELKGVVQPVHVFGVAAPGLAWLDRALVATQSSRGNLPRPQTDLVGDLVDLQRRVAALADNRLVTLTGSGGVGKTRAAVEIGWLVVDEFVDGVWLVELAPIADPTLVVAAVASTLGAQQQLGMTMVESIVDWCLGRRILLIFDNCEHVLTPSAELVAAIVAGCPTVTIVATSREPLGLEGERVVRVPSLDADQGVELFVNRASAAGAAFSGTPEETATITAVCVRLDGIPLAIELAAARSRSLSPQEVLGRLDDRFRLLRGGGRGALERHQTLRAAVTWSYQLLPTEQQWLFDRLSVFAGGFDLVAAEAVCGDDDIDALDVVDLLGELVDKSMVVAERVGAATRYRMLETLRQYGEERLDERGETTVMRDRHLAHFRGVAEGLRARWCSPAQVDVDAYVDREWDNLRAAHGWALTDGDFAAAVALLDGLGYTAWNWLRHEAAEWVDQTLALGDRLGVSDLGLLVNAGLWAVVAADGDRAVALADRGLQVGETERAAALNLTIRCYGLALSGRLDETADMVGALRDCLTREQDPDARYGLLVALIDLGSPGGDGSEDVEAFVALARDVGGPLWLAQGLRLQGLLSVTSVPPDVDGAIDAFRAAIEIADRSGLKEVGVWSRLCTAHAMLVGERAGCARVIVDSITYANDNHHVWGVDAAVGLGFRDLVDRSRLEPAAVLSGYVDRRPPQMALFGAALVDPVGALADLPDRDQLLAEGAAMTRQEIVAYTIAALDPS